VAQLWPLVLRSANPSKPWPVAPCPPRNDSAKPPARHRTGPAAVVEPVAVELLVVVVDLLLADPVVAEPLLADRVVAEPLAVVAPLAVVTGPLAGALAVELVVDVL
jgi:hypothetical protein